MFGINIDSPQQNSAMIDKLSLPFPLLSDPKRAESIMPLGVADEADAREIARPAILIVHPDGAERYRWVARDYADRLPEADLIAHLEELGLPPVTQQPPVTSDPQPGQQAMRFEDLHPYFRGARFAAAAMGNRHLSTKEDAQAYVEQMDRYVAAVRELRRTRDR